MGNFLPDLSFALLVLDLSTFTGFPINSFPSLGLMGWSILTGGSNNALVLSPRLVYSTLVTAGIHSFISLFIVDFN